MWLEEKHSSESEEATGTRDHPSRGMWREIETTGNVLKECFG